VDDLPEGDDDVTRTDLPVTREHTGPATDRVRIVGAEPAGEVTGELPVVGDVTAAGDEGAEPELPLGGSLFDQPTVHLTDEPGDPGDAGPVVDPVKPGETAVPGGSATPTELPHWTEPPTGQVPAVLARDSGDEASGPGIVAPSWREEDADWVAHDEEFEPAMFADDEVALGSLDESDSTDAARRPWEFNLDATSPNPTGPVRRVTAEVADEAAGGSASAADPITEPTEVVAPASGPRERPPAGSPTQDPDTREGAEPTTTISTAAVAAAGGAAASAAADRPGAGRLPPVPPSDLDELEGEELVAEPSRPSGSTRLSRARRGGLLPARLRAKRPENVDPVTEVPLAAEPPGASVTDVPGVGRKRGGVAGLAAADRTAERAADSVADATTTAGGGGTALQGSEAAVAVAAAATGSRRLSLRHRGAGRPAPVAPEDSGEGPTGGGPPAPRKPRPRPGEPGRPGPDPRAAGSSIGIRVGTGIAVAVIALLAFKLGTVPSLVLSAVVVTFAAGECFGVLRHAGYHPASLLGLVGTVSLMVGAYAKGVAALPLVLVLITVFTLIWYLFGIERGSPVAGTAATLLTVGWVSLLGAYAGLLLSPSAFPNRHGIAFLLGAIIATVANDVGALVIGGWLGSRPLAPRISPNKTWEGLFGGAVFSVLISTVVVGSIHPWSASNAALLGVVVAVVAPIGDLCESLLKRDLGLKDMGRLLPGHGGVLDRVDALLFVLPATYYLVRALNIA
jgi:CDP-diglyceride synthetase